jgi:hypothetical protein
MFHNDWTLLQLAKERERDLMRALEHDRLVQLARSTHARSGRRFDGVFNGLGQLLITLGRRLQAGHTVLLNDAALHATYHARSPNHTHGG